MKTISIALIVLLCVSSVCEAGRSRSRASTRRVERVEVSTRSSGYMTAQQRAELNAREDKLSHLGGDGPGYAEGVGFSSTSARNAIEACCFWGTTKVAVEIGVARGKRGWYACVRYE